MTFGEKYAALEREFKCQVEKDNKELGIKSLFLPNISPEGPVDFVLIAQEPSLGGGGLKKAVENIEQDDRNFSGSFEDFILHFCIREYLCQGGKSYHLTDLAKGAMAVRVAELKPEVRYERWYPLLEKELRVVAKPGARIISIGRMVERFLKEQKLDRHVGEIPHYALTANKHWGKSIKGREEAFRKFCATVSREDVERVAEEVLEDGGMGAALKEEKLKRLRRGSGLTESRKKLMFDYKVDFERMRG